MVTSLISHNIPISHKKVIIFLVSIWQKIYIWIYKRENWNIWEYVYNFCVKIEWDIFDDFCHHCGEMLLLKWSSVKNICMTFMHVIQVVYYLFLKPRRHKMEITYR